MTIKKPIQRTEMHANSVFGFWLYLMTDCLLFGSLFATFAVLRNQTAGSVDAKDIISLPFVLAETFVLLTSSLTSGLALLAGNSGNKKAVIAWLSVTAVLGLTFLGMELSEFGTLVHEGNSWTQSAFLSSYFGLVGTHGLHILGGLIWLFATMFYIWKRGLQGRVLRRLTMFTLFWHFLDIVWVCIFTIVYLVGVI